MLLHVRGPRQDCSTDLSGGSDVAQYAAELVNTKRAQALTKKARRLVSGWTPWDGCGVPIRSDSPVGTTALSPVGFVAPEKQPETLALLNPHPRDFAVRFVAAGHKYLIGGVPTRGSVTGMVHHFAQDFVEEEVIQAMQESAYWPRPSYLREDVLASELSVLASLEPDIVLEFLQRPRNEERLCQMMRQAQQRHPDLRNVFLNLALTTAEIARKWEAQRNEAAAYGTYVHYLFEAFINGYRVPMESPEFRMFQRFMLSLQGLRAYRTEWVIYGEAENIAGTIDFCAADAAGRLFLFDWKRSAGLRHKYLDRGQRMQRPLQHIADNQGNQYRLQLNCYKFLLEKYYGKEIAGMFVVCVHPDNSPDAFIDEVPNMLQETKDIMRLWELQSRKDSVKFRDASGGSVSSVSAADLPQDVLRRLATCFACPDYLRAYQACSRSCRQAVLDPSTWQGHVVHMELPNTNLLHFLRFVRMLRLWSRAEAVIFPAGRLSKIPQLFQNMRIDWSLEFLEGRDILNTHVSYLWESSRPLFGHAEFTITFKQPATAISLIMGARATHARTGIFQSMYCRLQYPFHETDMTLAYGLTGQQLLPVLCRRGPQLSAAAAHHVKVIWSETRLAVWLDGCLQPKLQLRPGTHPGPRSHSTFFVRIFALPSAGHHDFVLKPLPSKLEQDCVIKCQSCMYTSRLAAGGCMLCDQCQHWFCFRHLQLVGSATYCDPCAETVADALGGASATPIRQLSCEGEDAAQHPRLLEHTKCKDVLDEAKTSALGKRLRVVQKLKDQHSALLADSPEARLLLPRPANFTQQSKRRWERCVRLCRVVLDMLSQDMRYILFMYIHAQYAYATQDNPQLQQLVPHPLIGRQSAQEWRRYAVEFLLRCEPLLQAQPLQKWNSSVCNVRGSLSCREGQDLMHSRDYLGGASGEDADEGAVRLASNNNAIAASNSGVLAGVGHAAPSQPLPEASQDSFGQRVASELEEQMAIGLADNGQQTTKEEQVVEPEDPGLLQENEEIEDGAWDVLRKRRLLPGAASSDNDFRAHFASLALENAKFQTNCLKEPLDGSGAIRNLVSQHKRRVAEQFPEWSEYMSRIVTATMAVLTLRTVDVFLREHATVLWIIEGDSHMRFHHGDCYVLHPSNAFQQYKGVPLDCSRVHKFLMCLEGPADRVDCSIFLVMRM